MLRKSTKKQENKKTRKQISKKVVLKKAVIKKSAVKKSVAKKLVKKVVAKAKARKKSSKSLKSALSVQPQERMITLADLFRDEAPAKSEAGDSLASILQESLADMKNENKELTLADLFEDIDKNANETAHKLDTITLADLFGEEPKSPAAADSITLADLFENFDWDRVMEDVKEEAKKETVVAAAEPSAVPTSSMFHSVAIPHFSKRPQAEPGLFARIFNPQMLATVGVTVISLFFVSMWFQATKASVIETVSQTQDMQQAWDSVKDGFHSIQTKSQKVQAVIDEFNQVLEQQKMENAQRTISNIFGQAVQQKIDQTK